MAKYIMAIDQGTTSTRAAIVNQKGIIESIAQKEFTQYFPQPGWVEHDANEIWLSTLAVISELLIKNNILPADIAGIGITNQRETTVIWDKKTGNPVHNAIVWQSRQTAEICDQWKQRNLETIVKEKTGLKIDAYFSASKIKWILNKIDNGFERAANGELMFGTIDTWLLYKLSGGLTHTTDVTNAARTMLFNIKTLQWDDELLDLFEIPEQILPSVASSSEVYGVTAKHLFFGEEIPVCGIAGDQHAALFAQGCFEPGMVKNTYGTGCFMLMNTGNEIVDSKTGLLTTIAWSINGEVTYCLEGSTFVAGSAIQWLRDSLKIIDDASETETIALNAKDDSSLYVVPAFVGLGTPYWKQEVRGSIFGLTRGTDDNQLVKATLEAICYQNYDVLRVMEQEFGQPIKVLKVDGGMVNNKYLMQFQSDITNIEVYKPKITETTVLGAAYLAGLAVGFFNDKHEIANNIIWDKKYHPHFNEEKREKLYKGWTAAINATISFSENK